MSLRNVGQIAHADIEFGDLTVLVGQQATGKTVFLEMLKLVGDTGYIHSELTKHGFDWKADRSSFLSIFLGESSPALRDMTEWKTKLKGLYDKPGKKIPIIVTGSA